MSPWLIVIIAYLLVSLITLIPALRAWLKPISLNPGGPSFADSPYFSDDAKLRLAQNYERIQGTLSFWKHEAKKYEATHVYCMMWLIVLSALVPVLTQVTRSYGSDDIFSSIFLTITTTHIVLVTSLHKFFKVETNFKAFRLGESEFYDVYRGLLDNPRLFGETEDEQLITYFEKVSLIRKGVRSAETDTYAGLEEIRQGQAARQGP